MAGGDLPLLHRLEQCGLRLRRRAVDLIRQHYVGEHRPWQKAEGSLSRVAIVLNNLGAGNVRRHQIGSELDAIELERQRFSERSHKQRLGKTRDPHEQAMAACEQRDQQLLHDVMLPHDGFRELVPQMSEGFMELGDSASIVLFLHVRSCSDSKAMPSSIPASRTGRRRVQIIAS
jgi:hypothetical protein